MPAPALWTPALTFNGRAADAQAHVRTMQLRDGSFWVVWTDSQNTGAGSAAGTDVVGQRYDVFGVPIGMEVRLNSIFFADNEGNAQLAADVGSSEFYVVFEDRNADGSTDIVLERKSADGSNIGGVVVIAEDPDNTNNGIGFRNPQIAILSATNGLIVYERTNTAGNTDIMGQRFDPSLGFPTGAAFVIGDIATSVANPAITVTSDGRYAVVFNGAGDLMARFVEPNGTMSATFTPISGTNILDPSVAALDGGRLAVSFTNDAGGVNLLVLNTNGTIFANAGPISAGSGNANSHVARIDGDTIVVGYALGTTGVRTMTYSLSGTTLTLEGSNANFFSATQLDLSMTSLADGRILLGISNPLGRVEIRDPRDNANSVGVYNPIDMQIGTIGNDVFTAAGNVSVVHGWDGNDIITDGPGVEKQYFGGNGDDEIRFTFVDSGEFADGGAGNDTLVYTALAGPTQVDLGAGTATTGGQVQTVINFENFRSIVNVDMQVRAGDGFSFLTTGGGNDTLDLGAGGGIMSGGGGNDTYIVNSFSDQVVEIANQGTDTVVTTLSNYELEANVENLTYTGTAAATLRGNSGNNVVIGGAQGDLIFLHHGGNDSAFGANGDDGFFFGGAMTSLDSVNGGAGTDQIGLQGNYANLVLGAQATNGVEIVVLLGGDDTRFINFGGGLTSYNITTVDANVAAGQLLTFQANQLRAGENFTLNASAETNGFILAFGGLGTDTITGGGQGDGIYFGTGRFNAADTVNGGGGSDQVGFQGDYAGANALTFGAGQLTSVEFVVLLSATDTRFGGGGIPGQAFNYTVTMNDGNVLAGQQMVIQANSLQANEVLRFNGAPEQDGSFLVFGGLGGDTIAGGVGSDEINGGGGNDRIAGNGGADVLRGGAGSDHFVYFALRDSFANARDQILDFTTGDKIEIVFDANSTLAGAQSFELIANGAVFSGAGQLRITQNGTEALIEGEVNGDGVADFAIRVTVTDGHALTIADFVGVNDLLPAEPIAPKEFAAAIPWEASLEPNLDAFAGATSDLML